MKGKKVMKNLKHRIISVILSLVIFSSSLICNYEETQAFDVPTAFWGVMEGGRAMFTAMQTGGALDNGISFDKLTRTTQEAMRTFQTHVMIGYTAFCIYKEKIRLKFENPSMSDSEINSQAETSGQKMSQDFQNNAINVDNTTKNITRKDFGYWKEYCDNFSDVAKNGVGNGSSGGIGTEVNVPVRVFTNLITLTASTPTNTSANAFEYNGHYYITKGNYLGTQDYEVEQPSNPDRINIPYMLVFLSNDNERVYGYFNYLNIDKLTGEIKATGNIGNLWFGYAQDYQRIANDILAINNFPTIYIGRYDDDIQIADNFRDNYTNLAVSSGTAQVEDYRQKIQEALDSTTVGEAIKEGGVERSKVVPEDYVPVKRSSVKVGEETAEGVIGWDVPDGRTIEGSIAYPNTYEDLLKALGIISIPDDAIDGTDTDDTVVAWDKDIPISIPKAEEEEGDVAEDVPITDVISGQYGDYYPTQIALDEIFPFCIPFDIYYCIQKFNVSSGQAPVVHIPIVYPRALQGALGESYDVVIDFNDYIVLRNIIRGFLLLFFLVGLMLLTRNLIRG